MICVVLAAGYATRLYPLTENFPKPLLKVRERPILDWLLDDIDSTGLVDRYVVVSNHRYVEHFQKWASQKMDVLDDGSVSNETRLGAVRDIQFAIKTLNLDDDLFVIAGDNLLDFSLANFLAYAQQKGATCVMRYWEPSIEKLRRAGVAQVDGLDRIVRMVEKPDSPVDHWCVPPFYYYRREDVPLIGKAIEDGCPTDAPGSLIAWLTNSIPIHAMEMPGKRYDIGDLDSYREVQEWFRING
ncbi:MAG: nucleotidyltransferase family protein [Clostridia bacterium]|nr:nucleotidyltransferase family protein [Clostridia bacterium]